MPEPLLTIAVPTFNRNERLLSLVSRLLPQLTPEVRLTILDNCSDLPIAHTVETTLAEFREADVRLVRNKINIGANANILRCFEICETAWIWVIGDDDELQPNAVAIAVQRLKEHPDCLIVNFPIDDLRESPRSSVGLDAFVDAIDKSADVPWIASSIYKADQVLPNIRFGYQYSFCMLPHVAMLLMSVREHHECYFATDFICGRDRENAATDQQTPIVNMALGFPVLSDLPIPFAVRRRLVKKLLVTNDSPGLPLRQLAYQLLLQSVRSGDRANSLYCFDQACRRRFYFDQTLTERLETTLYRLMLMVPPSFVAGGYRLLKKKELANQVRQDQVARL